MTMERDREVLPLHRTQNPGPTARSSTRSLPPRLTGLGQPIAHDLVLHAHCSPPFLESSTTLCSQLCKAHETL